MGCDIHFYVETRQPDGSWKSADKWTEDEYEPGLLTVKYNERYYSERNYDLFAILADVRNGVGFAGIRTGEGFNPISLPRGIPDDACEEYKAESIRFGIDGHSHSYITVAELLSYDWLQVSKHQGWVDPSEWARWRDYGKPNSWSGAINGGTVRHLTPDDFENAWTELRIKQDYPATRYASAHIRPFSTPDNLDLDSFIDLLGGGMPVCLVEWSEPYYESVSSFWSNTMPRLLSLGKPEDVRACFFFDN